MKTVHSEIFQDVILIFKYGQSDAPSLSFSHHGGYKWCLKTMKQAYVGVLNKVKLYCQVNAFFCSNKFSYMLSTWVKTFYFEVKCIFYFMSCFRLRVEAFLVVSETHSHVQYSPLVQVVKSKIQVVRFVKLCDWFKWWMWYVWVNSKNKDNSEYNDNRENSDNSKNIDNRETAKTVTTVTTVTTLTTRTRGTTFTKLTTKTTVTTGITVTTVTKVSTVTKVTTQVTQSLW